MFWSSQRENVLVHCGMKHANNQWICLSLPTQIANNTLSLANEIHLHLICHWCSSPRQSICNGLLACIEAVVCLLLVSFLVKCKCHHKCMPQAGPLPEVRQTCEFFCIWTLCFSLCWSSMCCSFDIDPLPSRSNLLFSCRLPWSLLHCLFWSSCLWRCFGLRCWCHSTAKNP